MAVIYNTNYTHNPNAYLTLGVERAARNLFGKDQVVVADNMSLGQVAASGEHDTLICIDGQRINTQLLRRVRPAFRTMILWTFEDPFMRDFNVDNASLFDFVFTNDPSCASYYLGKGHYLPLAASQSIHERKIKTSAELDYDIFFAGTMWPNRVATLRHVIAAFPDARLKLICPGNEYLPPLPDDIAALAIQRPVSHEAFIDFANASAITLTMFRDYASHGDISQATAPGPRYYELALAGTAQVVEAPEIMDARYFEDVSGVALARDMKGVVDAIARLLSDPQAREDAAHRAQKSVLEHHLYENRLRQIAEISGADFGRRQQSLSRPPRRRRLRILMCTHSTIHEQAWGGVEVYQQTLCALLGREIEFFYWLRRGVHCRLTSASGQELERYDVPEVGWIDAMCDGAEEMAFSNAISQYNIDIVHFQHLGHHALSLPIIAKACGTGVVFSAHDFWLVSSRYNLLNHELRYNEGEVMSVVAQDVILKAAENIEYGCEETRRAFVSKMLHSVDAILFGTRHSHDLTHTVYPILDQKQSLTLGIPSPENTVPVTRKSFEPLGDRPLAIAIVGNFLRTKGADTILSLIDIAHPDYFEFHIFGYVHPEYDAVLKAYNRRNVKTYGRYTAGDIEALKIADVALNLSIWPETYCISLSEAWQNGLIPIVTDVGALGDRVVDGVNGFKVPIGRPSAVLERLELLRSSDAMRRRMMENITSDLWTNAQRYGEELKRVYESVAPVRELGIAELAIDSGQVHLIPHASWRHQAPPRHIFDPPTIRDLSIELPEVPEDWIDIQGGECYVDDVCNFILAEGTDDEFPGAQSFHMRGWYFVPGVRGSGTMYVTLIGAPDRPVIFIECTRELRGDIVSLFPDAPRRSGFNCEVALRGKWCEGSYRVGLVNVVNGQGTFQLTTIEIDVTGGAVVALRRSPPSNQTIMTGFSRVIHEDGILREVKLARIAQSGLRREDRASFEWYLDRLGQEPVTTGACEPETDIPVGGWAFMPGATGSGQLYIACVSDVNEEVFLFAMHRLARADVRKVHLGAPLMSGFSGNLRLGSGYARTMDGSYRVCIVNVVGEVIGVVLTNFGITTRSGVMVSIEHVDVSVEMSERVSALLGKKAFA